MEKSTKPTRLQLAIKNLPKLDLKNRQPWGEVIGPECTKPGYNQYNIDFPRPNPEEETQHKLKLTAWDFQQIN